jgi:carbamate kinase
MYDPARHRWLTGIEAVIDKDLASELLAREVNADLFVIATDVDAVYLDWGKPEQRKLGTVTPAELRSYNFPAGSMGPKVDAAFSLSSGPANVRPSAPWPRLARSWPERRGRMWWRGEGVRG